MAVNTGKDRMDLYDRPFAERWRDPLVWQSGSRKRPRLLSPLGIYAVMAVGAVLAGATTAFAI